MKNHLSQRVLLKVCVIWGDYGKVTLFKNTVLNKLTNKNRLNCNIRPGILHRYLYSFALKTAGYTYFSSTHANFPKIALVLGEKTIPIKV